MLDGDVQQRVAPLHDQQAGTKRGRIQVVGKLCHRAAGHRVVPRLGLPHSIICAHVNAISLRSIEMTSGSPSDWLSDPRGNTLHLVGTKMPATFV
jgi:hypothetical protein